MKISNELREFINDLFSLAANILFIGIIVASLVAGLSGIVIAFAYTIRCIISIF